MPETATLKQIQIALHEGQQAMLASTARTTVVTAGQGSGKTLGGYWWLLANMRALPGESHLLGFPDYGLLQRVVINQPDPDRQTIVQFLQQAGEAPLLYVQERRIQSKSGQIFFASGEDLVGWEGAHVKTAWLDEFDLMPLEAYRRAMERTRMREGYVLLTGTPRRIAWLDKELQPLWERSDPAVKRIQFPSTANPKYSQAAMDEAKRLLPSWEFARLYLGELARAEGGGVFKREWWKYYEMLPSPISIIQIWDTASKTKTANDYSVCATWGITRTGYYLLDIWRGKIEYPELRRMAITQYELHKPSRVLIEDSSNGTALIQELQHSTRLPIMAQKVEDKDKFSRASAITGIIESGKVFLPHKAAWLHDFVEEHALFGPKLEPGQKDDQVDTTVIALSYLARKAAPRLGANAWVPYEW